VNKICTKCNTEINEFYKSYPSVCKSCVKKSSVKWKKENPESISVHRANRSDEQARYYQIWYSRGKRLRTDRQLECIARWQHNNKEKVYAQVKLNRAVRAGEIIAPLRCNVCFEEKKLVAHHNDYDKPLEVLWVCYSCHKKIHIGKIILDNNKIKAYNISVIRRRS
jgi:hypothetical protein